jgi:hypothetical protein
MNCVCISRCPVPTISCFIRSPWYFTSHKLRSSSLCKSTTNVSAKNKCYDGTKFLLTFYELCDQPNSFKMFFTSNLKKSWHMAYVMLWDLEAHDCPKGEILTEGTRRRSKVMVAQNGVDRNFIKACLLTIYVNDNNSPSLDNPADEPYWRHSVAKSVAIREFQIRTSLVFLSSSRQQPENYLNTDTEDFFRFSCSYSHITWRWVNCKWHGILKQRNNQKGNTSLLRNHNNKRLVSLEVISTKLCTCFPYAHISCSPRPL